MATLIGGTPLDYHVSLPESQIHGALDDGALEMKSFFVKTLMLLATVFPVYSGMCASGEDFWIYFGTSTDKTTPEMDEHGISRSEGIYVGKFNSLTGTISDIRLTLAAKSSGYIGVASRPDRLWFVGTVDGSDGWANAYACGIDSSTGELSLMNGSATGGVGVCHIDVRSDAKFLTAANYSSGDFSVLKLKGDGSIDCLTSKFFRDGSGPLGRRQSHPYGHSSYFIETDGVCRVFMSDLGSDRINIARLDEETGEMTEDPDVSFLTTPAGAGPRHLTFMKDANGKQLVFSINELDSTISAFRVDFSSKIGERVGTWSTLEEKYREKLTDEESLVDGKTYFYGNKTAAIESVTLPNGKHVVYATNRGQNTVVVFDADSVYSGVSNPVFPLLQRISSNGSYPRFFMLDPTNRFLVVSNKKSGSIYVYAIDSDSGKLTLTSDKPTRLAWVIAGGFAPMKND